MLTNMTDDTEDRSFFRYYNQLCRAPKYKAGDVFTKICSVKMTNMFNCSSHLCDQHITSDDWHK